MGYLFMGSIGPIQSFIASSRRTRDLWFGSRLLSELSKMVAYAIIHEAHAGNELIFPAPDDISKLHALSTFTVANKIVAYIETDPREVGAKTHTIVTDYLNELQLRLYTEIAAQNINPQHFYRETARKQIDELVEYVWVAVPFDTLKQEPGYYDDRRKRVEALLAARKGTHDFKTVTWGSSQYKSSIDGQREAVIDNDFYYARRGDDNDKKRVKELRLYQHFHAGPAERLSGVDLLKRRGSFAPTPKGRRVDDFLSTSHVAALSYLQRLETLEDASIEKLRGIWKTYLAAITKAVLADKDEEEHREALASVFERIPMRQGEALKYPITADSDGALLFEERLLEDLSDLKQFPNIQSPLETFFKAIEDALGTQQTKLRPYPYYAIICADGDGMGKVIDQQSKQANGKEAHQKLSATLATFADSVKRTVEIEHHGTLIYAGGDDVLAFLPLHTVLSCAQKLTQDFHTQLKEFGSQTGESPKLSVGIAIVHHLSLLQESLSKARATEQRAKKRSGKNALALSICKRSGEEYGIVGQWGDIDRYLEQIIPYFQQPDVRPASFSRTLSIPKGTAYEIRDMSLRLTPRLERSDASTIEELAQIHQNLLDAINVDAIRILKRKLKPFAPEKQAFNDLLRLFKQRLGVSDAEVPTPDPGPESEAATNLELAKTVHEKPFQPQSVHIEEFIHELIVARELAEALDLAGMHLDTHKRELL